MLQIRKLLGAGARGILSRTGIPQIPMTKEPNPNKIPEPKDQFPTISA